MGSTPIRLSASLASRARKAASVQDRSMTDQVEHWARLGELVEATVSTAAVRQLKTVSHDEQLRKRLASADAASGRRKAARVIRSRGGPIYGIAPDDPTVIVRYERDGRQTRGRVVNGKFKARSSGK